jgi:RNase E specificity factor CsrD
MPDHKATAEIKVAVTQLLHYCLITGAVALLLVGYSSYSWLNNNATLSAYILSLPFLIALLLFVLFYVVIKKKTAKLFTKQLELLTKLEQWAIADQPLVLESKDAVSQAINKLQIKNQQRAASDAFEQKIRKQALLDIDTGIGNRAFLTNRLEALLHQEQIQGALFLLHVNEFSQLKLVLGDNQTFIVLEQIIAIIKKRLASLNHYFLARCNEDEIAILLPNLYVNEIDKLASKLIQGLRLINLPMSMNKDDFIHIGISCFNQQQSAYQVLAEADMALRSAQLQGPSQWFMFEQGEIEQEMAKGSLRWHTFLLKTIKHDRFILFYQSVISAQHEEKIHFAILPSINEQQNKLISARLFLPMAQKCGLVVDIDLVIFNKVIKALIQQQRQQLSCQYSINLSVDTLLSNRFKDELTQYIQKHSSVIQNVIIEINEYHLVEHITSLQPILTYISHQGIKLIVDKAGQYVVDLNYIQICPISAVNLDQSLILNIDEKLENQVVIQSYYVACQQKNIALYASGIENKNEWTMLKKIGIQAGQGKLFSTAMPLVVSASQVG